MVANTWARNLQAEVRSAADATNFWENLSHPGHPSECDVCRQNLGDLSGPAEVHECSLRFPSSHYTLWQSTISVEKWLKCGAARHDLSLEVVPFHSYLSKRITTDIIFLSPISIFPISPSLQAHMAPSFRPSLWHMRYTAARSSRADASVSTLPMAVAGPWSYASVLGASWEPKTQRGPNHSFKRQSQKSMQNYSINMSSWWFQPL